MSAKIPGFLHEADAIVPCSCGAVEGEPCKPDDRRGWEPGTVHFGRRLRRLMLTGKATEEQREKFEREAVAMLREELRKRSAS